MSYSPNTTRRAVTHVVGEEIILLYRPPSILFSPLHYLLYPMPTYPPTQTLPRKPSHIPLSSLLLVVRQYLLLQLRQFTAGAAEDATYHEERRSQDVPADSPVVARSKADHVLDVVTEAASTVDPRDSYCLKQHGDQDRIPSSVTVQEMEEVKSTLGHS